MGIRKLGDLYGVSHTTMAKLLREGVAKPEEPPTDTPLVRLARSYPGLIGSAQSELRTHQLYLAWKKIADDMARKGEVEANSGNQ